MRIAEFGKRINQDGFTLIETIIVLVVLSIAAVGVLSVFTAGIKGSANPLIMNQATQLAQGEMDQVLGEKTAYGFNAATLAQGTPACNSTMLSAAFICTRTICFVPVGNLNDQTTCAAATNYKHITVTITHAAIGNMNLETVIAFY